MGVDLVAPRSFYVTRSAHESLQMCPRQRYLGYHHLETGVTHVPTRLELVVGSAAHVGLGMILNGYDIQECVQESLNYLIASDTYRMQLKESERLEQMTLIAALLLAFWFRIWPQLSQQFDVLMVERAYVDTIPFDSSQLVISSRPDAILRDKQTKELVGWSWKTINNLTDYKRKGFHNDLQGSLEGYYGEKLLQGWLDDDYVPDIPSGIRGKALIEHMEKAIEIYRNIPKEIDYVQMVYLVKGERSLSLPDGTEVNLEDEWDYRDAEKVWRQDSFLCYKWFDAGEVAKSKQKEKEALPPVAWNTRYYKPENKGFSLLGKTYSRIPVWEVAGDGFEQVSQWIESLNRGEVFPSTVPDERNDRNPLDRIVIFDAPIYRNQERRVSLRNQLIEAEIRWANQLVQIEELRARFPGAAEPLDINAPQHLISCRSPYRCQFHETVCNTAAAGPLFDELPKGGVWKRREAHHAVEAESEVFRKYKGK